MKFIDFFAGIGGFRLGMEQAGHECVGHCEIDKFADKSYRAMHDVKESEWYADDITRVEPDELPEADCYCFGFPCQAFSIAGNRRGFEDTRGTLFFEVMRLAKERKPRILFAENVKGLLNHDRGRTFGIIISTMDELGYDVEWQVLNSANFGVPQNRERVFIIGHFRGRSKRKIFPIRDGAKEANELQRQHIGTITTRTGESQGVGTYAAESEQPAQNATQVDTSNIAAIPVLTLDRVEKRQNGRRFKENGEPMFTLTGQDRHGVMLYQKPRGNNRGGTHNKATTLTGNSWQENNVLLSGYRIRKLTPRECFRLQGFPDEYFDRAAAVNSDSQLYKQAGNSVTVNVIYEIARRLT